MLQNIPISKNIVLFKNSEKVSVCMKILFVCMKIFIDTDNNKNVSWAVNLHIRMISEGSCDTEDWSNDAKNSALYPR